MKAQNRSGNRNNLPLEQIVGKEEHSWRCLCCCVFVLMVMMVVMFWWCFRWQWEKRG